MTVPAGLENFSFYHQIFLNLSIHLRRSIDNEITCLKCLERLSAQDLSKEERAELYRLFGGRGPEVWTRIGLPATAAPAEVNECLWDRHDHWARRKSRASGDLLKICEHALSRLGTILDYLEEQGHD